MRGRGNPDYGASEGYHLGAYDSLVMDSIIYGEQSRSGEPRKIVECTLLRSYFQGMDIKIYPLYVNVEVYKIPPSAVCEI